jgi:ankyrin repeat protein
LSAPLNVAELEFLHGVLNLARAGESTALAAAVDAGVPVNLTNAAGDSLLILAAYHCHPETVGILLARGADTERVNDNGQTALAAATFRRHLQIMRMLLAAGANPATGSRSAVQISEFFGLSELAAVLSDTGPQSVSVLAALAHQNRANEPSLSALKRASAV